MGAHLWNWFWDIRESQPSGFSGPNPISNQEIVAWLALTGNIVRREEIGAIKVMDAAYIRGVAEESEAIREREADG